MAEGDEGRTHYSGDGCDPPHPCSQCGHVSHEGEWCSFQYTDDVCPCDGNQGGGAVSRTSSNARPDTDQPVTNWPDTT